MNKGQNTLANRGNGQRTQTNGSQRKAHAQARMGASPARLAALKVLRLVHERDAYAQELISKYIDETRMVPEEKGFATLLVLGAVSSQGTLDEVLNACMRSPSDVQDDVRDALRLSAYEIIFLKKSPYAAVDQGVELVRSIAPRAAGVANAVLRKVVAASQEFPFGDVERDLAALARSYAFPQWLAQLAIEDLGLEDARAFMEVSNEPAPLFVAFNALNTSMKEEDALEVLVSAKGDPQPVHFGDTVVQGCYRIANGRVLQDGRIRRMLNNGVLVVSDAASQAVSQLVLPDTCPASVLEVGAGRGTKTILLQSQAMRRFGSQMPGYHALDNHAFKTQVLLGRMERSHVRLADACTGDATQLDTVFPGKNFDLIFIDAPCSGLGTLRRHPEIRWRLQPSSVHELALQGMRFLKSAASHVALGGTLAYATCTFAAEENQRLIAEFLKSEEGSRFALTPVAGKSCFASRLSSKSPDAHFAVRMVRMA